MPFSSLELAFDADDENITIIPKQTIPSMEMIGWKTPHLRPLRRSVVPLWFAVVLKRQDRCTILWPEWMNSSELRKYVEQERTNSQQYTPLPWHWQAVSQIVLKEASDDCTGQIDEVMQLLQDLRELRLTKTRAGLLLANESHLQMTGLGGTELNETMPVLAQTMRTLQKIQDATKE